VPENHIFLSDLYFRNTESIRISVQQKPSARPLGRPSKLVIFDIRKAPAMGAARGTHMRIQLSLTLASCALLSACNPFSSQPSAEVAQAYMSRLVGSVSNTKITNCSGDSDRQTCVVSYNRSFGPGRYYEELNMDFQKTPSGWNVLRYKVIKTDTL
jgi:hypothetical protein